MKLDPRWSALAALALVVAGCDDSSSSTPAPPAVAEPTWNARVVVADAASPKAVLVDLDSGKIHDLGALAGLAAPYRADDGRTAFLVMGSAHRVKALDGGLQVEAHGDHEHVLRRPWSWVAGELSDSSPAHFVPHDGWNAIFHDAAGTVSLVSSQSLNLSRPLGDRSILRVGRQHGVAVPLAGDLFATTRANPEYLSGKTTNSLPTGVQIRNLSDSVVRSGADTLCNGLHGEAVTASGVTFGCADGILLVAAKGTGFEARRIPDPASLPAAARTGTLKGHHDLGHVFAAYANAGTNLGIWKVSLTDGAAILVHAGSDIPVAWAVDEHAEFLVVVSASGTLTLYDAVTGAVKARREGVIGTITDHGNHGAAYPGMDMLGGLLFLTDPAAGRLLVLDEELATVKTVAIAGRPGKIAVLGSPGSEEHQH